MTSRTITTAALLTTCLACGGSTTQPAPPPPTAAKPPVVANVDASPAVDAGPADAGPTNDSSPARTLQMTTVPLAGATEPALLDYITYDQGRLWIPFVSGKKGIVDVFDAAKGTFSEIDGFKTVEREAHGKTRALGPSSVSVGDGVAYVGNRGTSEVCVIDAAKLKIGKCLKTASPPDGVAYVASVKEVWVTTPQTQSIAVLDASDKNVLKLKTTIKTDGEPEGYAVDAARDLFFTNLEDKNRTLAIDLKTHSVKSNWSTGCGADGPRGIAIDPTQRLAVVACTDHLQALDPAHDGALLGTLAVGAGIDNIDFAYAQFFAAAGKAGQLMVTRLDSHGRFAPVASGATAEGARNAVSGSGDDVYVVDGKNSRLIVVHVSAPGR